jgi:hypothetical protein
MDNKTWNRLIHVIDVLDALAKKNNDSRDRIITDDRIRKSGKRDAYYYATKLVRQALTTADELPAANGDDGFNLTAQGE